MGTEIVRYDREADVLYLWSKNPEDVEGIVSEETGEEILVDRDAETGERVGITIMHFSQRQDAVEGIKLPTSVPETA